MAAKKVLAIRRDKEQISPTEMNAIMAVFPDQEIEFLRTDPIDYREHLRDCERLNPDIVLLPVERPIPSAAMEKGYKHVTVAPGGTELLELLPLKPSFTKFLPTK